MPTRWLGGLHGFDGGCRIAREVCRRVASICGRSVCSRRPHGSYCGTLHAALATKPRLQIRSKPKPKSRATYLAKASFHGPDQTPLQGRHARIQMREGGLDHPMALSLVGLAQFILLLDGSWVLVLDAARVREAFGFCTIHLVSELDTIFHKVPDATLSVLGCSFELRQELRCIRTHAEAVEIPVDHPIAGPDNVRTHKVRIGGCVQGPDVAVVRTHALCSMCDPSIETANLQRLQDALL
mmetsp:Transcript_91028/g.257166  ORF Transcript_91028/g.257166 Transcript_91028/m.257166 type:complete len:240 (+) Transcript_91028:323-1042(+)